MSGSIQQGYGIINPGVIVLVGADEALAAERFSGSVEIPLNDRASGDVLSVSLIARETGSGAVLQSVGTLYLFDEDPGITLADTSLGAAGAGHLKCIGAVAIEAADWNADAGGAIAIKTVSVPFGPTKSLWASFFLAAGGTTINSAAGDNEILSLRMTIRRDQ